MKDVSGSLSDLANRHAGTPSTSYEDALRRREQPLAAPEKEEPFDAAPADITSRALHIAEVRSGLGVPHGDGSLLAEVAQLVDENADFVTPILIGLLRHLPKVAQGARVQPEKLAALDEQRAEMGDLRITATQLRRDVLDTRRKTSADVRAMGRTLVEYIQQQLAPGRLSRAEQDLLRSDAGDLLGQWQALSQAPRLERDKTVAADRAHEEKLLAEEEQHLMLRTMLALRGGDAVDQEEWDHAAEIYDALSATSESANRRRRSR